MSNSDHLFHGSIPELYDRYMGPSFFEPYAADLASRLHHVTSGNVLELAAGTGILSRALARSLPREVSILATDLNQPMLDHASKVSDSRIVFRQANAQQLPFSDSSFDCVVCQFGVMFFPDKAAAYREARRVLKPAGRFLFSVWDRVEENELSAAAAQGIRSFFANDPPTFISRTPFSYFDVPLIQRELRGAGFSTSSVETVILRSHASSALDVALGMIQGTPLRNEIEARDPNLIPKLTDSVASHLTARFGHGPFETRMQAHIFTALP